MRLPNDRFKEEKLNPRAPRGGGKTAVVRSEIS